MFIRCCAALLLLGWVLPPAFLHGQHTHAHDVEVISPPRIKPAADAKKPELARAVKRIIEKTNAFRKEEGRSPVEVNAQLTPAAEYFAGYMAKTDRYGHTADGKQPADRAKERGYDYCIVLENIAYEYNSRGFSTEELAGGFFEGWKKSPGHRRNMLDADVTQTAVAVARSEKTGYYYAVQMFGRPKSQAIEFSIANESDLTVKYQIEGQTFTLEPRYTRTHTRCRPGEMTFLQGNGKADEEKKYRPANGGRFAIVNGDNGGFQVKKQ